MELKHKVKAYLLLEMSMRLALNINETNCNTLLISGMVLSKQVYLQLLKDGLLLIADHLSDILNIPPPLSCLAFQKRIESC